MPHLPSSAQVGTALIPRAPSGELTAAGLDPTADDMVAEVLNHSDIRLFSLGGGGGHMPLPVCLRLAHRTLPTRPGIVHGCLPRNAARTAKIRAGDPMAGARCTQTRDARQGTGEASRGSRV